MGFEKIFQANEHKKQGDVAILISKKKKNRLQTKANQER